MENIIKFNILVVIYFIREIVRPALKMTKEGKQVNCLDRCLQICKVKLQSFMLMLMWKYMALGIIYLQEYCWTRKILPFKNFKLMEIILITDISIKREEEINWIKFRRDENFYS